MARIIIPGIIFGGIIGKFLSNNPQYLKSLNPKRWITEGKRKSKKNWLLIVSISIGIGIFSRYLLHMLYIFVANIWEAPIAENNIFSMIPLPLLLVSIILIPIFEEWIFRGVILEEISKISNSTIIGLASSSLIFAIFHLSNPGTHIAALIPYFFAGMVLGGGYLVGGLAVAILSHVFCNISPFLLDLIYSLQ